MTHRHTKRKRIRRRTWHYLLVLVFYPVGFRKESLLCDQIYFERSTLNKKGNVQNCLGFHLNSLCLKHIVH